MIQRLGWNEAKTIWDASHKCHFGKKRVQYLGANTHDNLASNRKKALFTNLEILLPDFPAKGLVRYGFLQRRASNFIQAHPFSLRCLYVKVVLPFSSGCCPRIRFYHDIFVEICSADPNFPLMFFYEFQVFRGHTYCTARFLIRRIHSIILSLAKENYI